LLLLWLMMGPSFMKLAIHHQRVFVIIVFERGLLMVFHLLLLLLLLLLLEQFLYGFFQFLNLFTLFEFALFSNEK